MSRTAKIAGVATLAGMMMTVAIVAVTHDRANAPLTPAAVRPPEGQNRLARELGRCATLTMPDSGCEAAWAANRRRFFRQDDPATEEQHDGGMAPDAEGARP